MSNPLDPLDDLTFDYIMSDNVKTVKKKPKKKVDPKKIFDFGKNKKKKKKK